MAGDNVPPSILSFRREEAAWRRKTLIDRAQRSRAIKAKTDRIDARLIRDFVADELTRRGAGATILGDDLMIGCVSGRRGGANWSRRCTPRAAVWRLSIWRSRPTA